MCDKCGESFNVGTGGKGNMKKHQESSKCRNKCQESLKMSYENGPKTKSIES
jgi:hypothetical protein